MENTEKFIAALKGGRGELDEWLEDNSEADCRLAMVPIVQQRDELLAALKDACEWIESCVPGDAPKASVASYRAAIAKATGASHD